MVCHNCEALASKHGRDCKGNQRFKCSPCNRTFKVVTFSRKPHDKKVFRNPMKSGKQGWLRL